MGRLARGVMVGVGVVVLVTYTALAVAGLAVVQWLVANPPDTLTLVAAFLAVVLVTSSVGYSLGSLRVVASLDATELPAERAPEVYRRLARLSARSRVKRPRVLVADLDAPNALSIGGPRRGVIVLDPQLFELLTIDELEAILAHELAHMERYDTFCNTLAVTAARTVVGLAFVFLFPVVLVLVGIDRATAWFAGRPGRPQVELTAAFRHGVIVVLGGLLFVFMVAVLAYSRRQEFAADRRATELTGKPVALARGLAKIHHATTPRDGLLSILYVHEEPQQWWLSTHPPVEERIDRLLAQADVGPHHSVSRLRPR